MLINSRIRLRKVYTNWAWWTKASYRQPYFDDQMKNWAKSATSPGLSMYPLPLGSGVINRGSDGQRAVQESARLFGNWTEEDLSSLSGSEWVQQIDRMNVDKQQDKVKESVWWRNARMEVKKLTFARYVAIYQSDVGFPEAQEQIIHHIPFVGEDLQPDQLSASFGLRYLYPIKPNLGFPNTASKDLLEPLSRNLIPSHYHRYMWEMIFEPQGHTKGS